MFKTCLFGFIFIFYQIRIALANWFLLSFFLLVKMVFEYESMIIELATKEAISRSKYEWLSKCVRAIDWKWSQLFTALLVCFSSFQFSFCRIFEIFVSRFGIAWNCYAQTHTNMCVSIGVHLYQWLCVCTWIKGREECEVVVWSSGCQLSSC